MGPIDVERVRILYLNSRNMLIRDELASEGSSDQSAIYVREVIKRALELGASALILVHNHPRGRHAQSRQDIAITQNIEEAAAKLGNTLHDHSQLGGHAVSTMPGVGGGETMWV